MSDNLIIVTVGLALFIVFAIPLYARQHRLEKVAKQAQAEALRYGLHEPVSLHPVVDAGACIGTGNCVSVCPEGDVLGLRSGQATPISPARCIGHGLCERACPTQAIKLVFGTERRGVDIPRIKGNFETNVTGIYIVGELGGMGLIRNAFEQGRQCVEGIAKESRRAGDALDVVIVGCGPAGLSASVNCIHQGLNFVTLEKEDIGGTVRSYPRKKVVMTSPIKVPGYGKLGFREIRKEELMAVWEDIVMKTGLEVRTQETVSAVTRTDDGSLLVTSDKGTYKTKRVILAIGRRGVPRKLNLPGERLPKVIYSLREPEAFQRDRIVVVGGGDSAVEAALALASQPGNDVKIVYRRDRFARIKPGNQGRIEDAITRRRIEVLWSSNLIEIQPQAVVLKDGSGTVATMPNDVVAVFAGGELPTKFLHSCGIEIDTKFGEA